MSINAKPRETDSILFTPVRVGRLTILNRFVRSATHDYMSGEDGSITPRQVALFRRLAELGRAGRRPAAR